MKHISALILLASFSASAASVNDYACRNGGELYHVVVDEASILARGMNPDSLLHVFAISAGNGLYKGGVKDSEVIHSNELIAFDGKRIEFLGKIYDCKKI